MRVRERVFERPDVPYQVALEREAWRQMTRFAQHWPWTKEGGGQLFGVVEKYVVCVQEATPPRKGDVRTRISFDIHPDSAAREIAEREKNGLLYLGDWHTHPERKAKPSPQDMTNARRLFSGARGRPFLVAIIVGTERHYIGLFNSITMLPLTERRR